MSVLKSEVCAGFVGQRDHDDAAGGLGAAVANDVVAGYEVSVAADNRDALERAARDLVVEHAIVVRAGVEDDAGVADDVVVDDELARAVSRDTAVTLLDAGDPADRDVASADDEDALRELAHRPAGDRHVAVPVDLDAGVVTDAVAVDRVAGEIERDPVGADDETAPGAVAEVRGEPRVPRDRVAAGNRPLSGGGERRRSEQGERQSKEQGSFAIRRR